MDSFPRGLILITVQPVLSKHQGYRYLTCVVAEVRVPVPIQREARNWGVYPIESSCASIVLREIISRSGNPQPICTRPSAGSTSDNTKCPDSRRQRPNPRPRDPRCRAYPIPPIHRFRLRRRMARRIEAPRKRKHTASDRSRIDGTPGADSQISDGSWRVRRVGRRNWNQPRLYEFAGWGFLGMKRVAVVPWPSLLWSVSSPPCS